VEVPFQILEEVTECTTIYHAVSASRVQETMMVLRANCTSRTSSHRWGRYVFQRAEFTIIDYSDIVIDHCTVRQ